MRYDLEVSLDATLRDLTEASADALPRVLRGLVPAFMAGLASSDPDRRAANAAAVVLVGHLAKRVEVALEEARADSEATE